MSGAHAAAHLADIDGYELIAPKAYGERGIPHDQWTELRRLDHLHRCEPRGFDSFYAVARHRDPFTFRIDRQPNPHLAFGIGEHFCLGAHLARHSQRALLAELVRRIDSIELAGEPEPIQSSFVVGLKKLPLRYRPSRTAREAR